MSAKKKSINSIKLVNDSEKAIMRPRDAIEERRSQELVIAFAGPIGCGINAVKDNFLELLADSNYEVHHIKISDYLEDCLDKGLVKSSIKQVSDRADRYLSLQDAGNELRKTQSDILAEYAIQKIAEIRTKKVNPEIELTDYVPVRAAYLIDQLKHQDEVSLLRAVYGNLFYLFGVLSTSTRRADRLKNEGVKDRFSDLMERDRKQREKNGQQLDKTLQLADFFIRNDHANTDALKFQVKRSIDLVHGVNGITPTKEEYGMYVAYASGLRSACLSRQVGASIMNDDGVIIATGRNDVPKGGGGLYGPEEGISDARCIKIEGSECFNDKHKQKVAKEIESVIKSKLNVTVSALEKEATPDQKAILQGLKIDELSSGIVKTAYEDTRLGGLIEFSRSIHAEMDAIVSLAFKGTGSTDGATLFTYTFPCHNCARHIVAAGIKRVYYLEPYEKSLAIELHGDAIDVDGQQGGLGNKSGTLKRVEFLHFEGVAPRQYLNMFTPFGERKDESGKAVKSNVREAEKKIPEYLDNYRDYEVKVVQHLAKLIDNLKSKNQQEGL
jgi:deoxycytidylate deaminase